MANILVKNVHMLDNSVVNIGISENRILFIQKEIPSNFPVSNIIDGTNKLAAPGFVNTHTHAAMTLFRSYADDMNLMDWLQNKIWPAEAKLVAEDVYWGTMLSIAEMLRSGTTAFADMYFFMDEVAKAVEETSIRGVLARGLTGDDNNDGKSLLEAKNFYKQWHKQADGRITVMFGPHAPYTCSRKFLEKVIDAAGEVGANMHIHLSETKGEVAECLEKHGKTPIAYMDSIGLFTRPTLAAHCTFATDEEIAIMQEKKVNVAHNPQSNLKLASGVAPVPQMLKAGVVVGLGTDGASSNNNLDLFEEMRLAAMLHKGVTNDPLVVNAREALEMATVNGAKAVWLENTGNLSVGAKADIVLYNMDKPHWYPRFDLCQMLVYSAQSADVDTVIVDGKVLLNAGNLLTIDEEKVKYETEIRAKKLTNYKA